MKIRYCIIEPYPRVKISGGVAFMGVARSLYLFLQYNRMLPPFFNEGCVIQMICID